MLVLIPAIQWFFLGFFGYHPTTKTNTSKFQFNLETADKGPLCGMCQSKFFIYWLFNLFIAKEKPGFAHSPVSFDHYGCYSQKILSDEKGLDNTRMQRILVHFL